MIESSENRGAQMGDELDLAAGDVAILAGDRPGLVLALGQPGSAAPELGEVVGKAGGPVLARLLDAAGLSAAAGASAGFLDARWVRLTEESASKLAERGFAHDGDGLAMGLIRGDRGRIEHVVRFAEGTNPVAAALMVQSLATQARLQRIEQKLDELSEKVDVLLEGSRIEVEAQLAANLDTLRRIERRVEDRGRVDDADWSSLAAIESPIKQVYHQTVQWLAPLRAFLHDGELNVREQVQLLRANLGVRDVEFWLRMHVYSELAMKRWELLYLWHEADAAPERLAAEAAQFESRAAERHEELAALYLLLADYLDGDDELSVWQRLQVLNRVRLARLRIELGQVANAYGEALDQATFELPEYVPDDAAGASGPIIDVSALRDQVGGAARDALTAGAEIGARTGEWMKGRTDQLARLRPGRRHAAEKDEDEEQHR